MTFSRKALLDSIGAKTLIVSAGRSVLVFLVVIAFALGAAFAFVLPRPQPIVGAPRPRQPPVPARAIERGHADNHQDDTEEDHFHEV